MNLRREILITTSPKNVWRALTNPHDLTNWASETCEVTQDRYVLAGGTVFGGQMGGDVIERTEGSTLRFQWLLDGAPTEVTIQVLPEPQSGMPAGNFAKVCVEHRNIPDDFRPSPESRYPECSFEASWILWLRHLALWAERAMVTGRFHYQAPLSAVVEKSVIVEAEVDVVWRYITDSELRDKWFDEPMGNEVGRVEGNQVSYAWFQDAPGVVTFRVEPMANQRSLVIVHHEGVATGVRYDYQIGWQDYLVSLAHCASVPLIRQTIWIDASPEQVWGWFTSESAMQQWWNPTTSYEPVVGGHISFSDHGSDLHGIVTELTPHARFAFTIVEDGPIHRSWIAWPLWRTINGKTQSHSALPSGLSRIRAA